MSIRNNGTRRVSAQQLDILWEFLMSHRDIAKAFNRSLQAKEYSFKKWSEIAATLNALGDGVHKDWKGWSKYWVDFKAKFKKKVAAVRASQARTGGGPSNVQPLSEIETKYLQLLGADFGQGLSGVQVDPLLQPSGSGAISSMEVEVEDSPASESILLPLNTAEDAGYYQFHPEQFPTIATPSPNRTRTPSSPPPRSTPAPMAAAAAASGSVTRRRRRREPPMTQDAARRALVNNSRIQADAALSSSAALESIARSTEDLCDLLRTMQRFVSGAFPTAFE